MSLSKAEQLRPLGEILAGFSLRAPTITATQYPRMDSGAHPYEDSMDPTNLGPARGIILSLGIVVPFWVLVLIGANLWAN